MIIDRIPTLQAPSMSTYYIILKYLQGSSHAGE